MAAIAALVSCGAPSTPRAGSSIQSAGPSLSPTASASRLTSPSPSATPTPLPAYYACEDAHTCPPLESIGMTFDPVQREVVTFGGMLHASLTASNQTWTFRNGQW